MSKIRNEQKQKALELYNNNKLSLKDIAIDCNISYGYLLLLTQEAIRAGIIKSREKGSQISNEQKQKVISLYNDKSLTLREIANLCDISVPSIQRIVRDAVEIGVLKPRDEFRKNQSKARKFTESELEEIAVDYYENGLAKPQLQEKWNIHPMQLQRIRKKFGDKYKQKTRGTKEPKTILQFDKQGNLIAEYPSLYKASFDNNIPSGNIYNCCIGNRYKSVGGFVWKFKD